MTAKGQMSRGLLKGILLLGLFGLFGLLASCAETELAVHNAKQFQAPASPAVQSGTYKVGQPYQISNVWYYPREEYDYNETGIASWYGPGFHGKLTANGEVYDQNAMTGAHRTLPMPSLVQVTNLENGRSIQVRINDRGPFAHGRIIDLSKRAANLLGFVQQGTARVRVEVLEMESRELAMAAGADLNDAASAPLAAPVETVAVQQLPPVGGAAVEEAALTVQPAAEPVRLRAVTQLPPEPVVTQGRAQRTEIYVQAGAYTQVANAVRTRARLVSLGEVQISKALVGSDNFYRVRVGPIATVAEADQTLELLLANGFNDARVVVD